MCGALHAREENHVYEYANADTIDIDLIDAITAQPIVDGVQLSCGHMFSRRSILQWLATHHACPVCRTPAAASDLKLVVRFARNKLDELLVCHDLCDDSFIFQRVRVISISQIQLDVTFYVSFSFYIFDSSVGFFDFGCFGAMYCLSLLSMLLFLLFTKPCCLSCPVPVSRCPSQ